MNGLLMVHDAITKIEEAAGCVCFLASQCDHPAMYARLYWEEPKPCEGVVWANGQGWTILPEAHRERRKALLDCVDALPRKEIYTFINLIESKIADSGRVEFSRIMDVLYVRVSWKDDFHWEYGIGKHWFDQVCIERLVEEVNVSRSKRGGAQ